MTPVVRTGHDARLSIPQAGNVLAEYGLIIGLVTLASVTSLMMLSQSMQKNWVSIGDNFQGGGHNIRLANAETAPNRPTISTFMITLSNGKQIVLDEYPLDIPTDTETPIPSHQQSKTASRQLKMLASTLEKQQFLTHEQANTLLRLSQQMDYMADLEKPLEDTLNSNTQTARAMVKSTFKIRGQQYTLDELLELIRTDPTLRGEAPEIEELMTRVEDARDAGALNDPVIQHIVNRMVESIRNAASILAERAERQTTTNLDTSHEPPRGQEHHVLGQNG
jgi:Flp pilus assembly pilin Flp